MGDGLKRAFAAARATRKKKTRAHDASKFHVVAIEGIRSLAGTKLERDHPTVSVPGYRLPSAANQRLHWRKAMVLKKGQRDLGSRMAELLSPDLPCTITLTRVSPRLLDDDNLASAFKSVRDGIAAEYGVDDGPTGPVTWRYEQRRGPYAIEARHEVRAKTSVYDKPVELCGECCGVPNFPYCRTHTPITWAYFNTPLEERTHENHDAMVEEQRAARHEVRG